MRSTADKIPMQFATDRYPARFRVLEKKLNETDTSKLEFAAIETLLGSKKMILTDPKFRTFLKTFRHYK